MIEPRLRPFDLFRVTFWFFNSEAYRYYECSWLYVAEWSDDWASAQFFFDIFSGTFYEVFKCNWCLLIFLFFGEQSFLLLWLTEVLSDTIIDAVYYFLILSLWDGRRCDNVRGSLLIHLHVLCNLFFNEIKLRIFPRKKKVTAYVSYIIKILESMVFTRFSHNYLQ